MILAYPAPDSERGDWRARPAMDVLARGVSRRFGASAEAQLAPEPLPAAARDAGLTAALPHDSVTAVGSAASGLLPGALRHGPAEALPHDPVTAGVWLEPEP